MKILHTEASIGWGGQEMRIMAESVGMRERGHTIVFATAKGAKLAEKAREEGFQVYEIPLKIKEAPMALYHLIRIIRKEEIDLINTHSSSDAWLGGIAARICRREVIRTRHLSNPIKPGLNSKVLYNWLADFTVTTCQEVADRIRRQADLPESRCCSIPTGVDPQKCVAKENDRLEFRRQYGIADDDIVIGTLCVVRSWKGIGDLLQAAKKLESNPKLKWLIVGNGPHYEQFKEEAKSLGIQNRVIFTGFIPAPFTAVAAMDIFTLLSTRSEGVSQSVLQAGYLHKPLITSTIGGLPEVCRNGATGFCVQPQAVDEVARAVSQLADDPRLRAEMGNRAHQLVSERFLLQNTLDDMEEVYKRT